MSYKIIDVCLAELCSLSYIVKCEEVLLIICLCD